MNLRLVKLSKEYKKQLEDMLDEWISYNNVFENENKSPNSIFKNDYHDFDNYLKNLEIHVAKDGLVPDSTLFLLDEERDIFLGACNIRHYLNDYLLKAGGHIGDGIRPSERRKGYGTKLISLALVECKKLGIKDVLISCDKNNIGSAKAIMNNGGILENEIVQDGVIIQRYWIKL